MVSELVEFKGHLPIHAPIPKSAGHEGGVLGKNPSPTLDMRWPDNVFMSGGSPHLTSRFGGAVLGPTTISKMVSEPLQDPLGHLLSGFCYRGTHRLCPQTKPNSVGREKGVLRVPHQI